MIDNTIDVFKRASETASKTVRVVQVPIELRVRGWFYGEPVPVYLIGRYGRFGRAREKRWKYPNRLILLRLPVTTSA